MKRHLKSLGLAISLGSALLGFYFVRGFGASHGPDYMLSVAPLFFLGLPTTILGNILGLFFGVGGHAAGIILAYFAQWQFVAWRLYRIGEYSD